MSNNTELSVQLPPISRTSTEQLLCTGSPFANKERMRCMFCGGELCKRCGPTAYLQLQRPAIPNLHSSWINDSILAMQRPSDKLLIEGNVLEEFKKANITAVFNLTEPGEHPYCGDGVLPGTGFPYSPEKLMRAGIKHFNFHWPDMTAPSMATMMEIAHIGAAEINRGGKIAVHCHAGFGRTGMAIACILIFKDLVESTQVITFIRNRRPGSIQTATQERFIKRFERSFRFLMQSFPTKNSLELSNSGDGSFFSTGSMSSNALSRRLNFTSSMRSPISPPNGSNTTTGSNSSNNSNSNNNTSSNVIYENTDTSLYLKTIQQSVSDQRYLLSPVELAEDHFRCLHKIVYFTTLAISALSRDILELAHLGFTGLKKLIPKENMSHKFTSNLSKHNMNFLMNAPSYMVAANSMSKGLEETILTDIKLEINNNKWTRFASVADVVAISLKLGQESVKRLTKVSSTLDAKSPGGSMRFHPHSPHPTATSAGAATSTVGSAGSAGNVSPEVTGGRVSRNNSMFRENSLRENTDAEYNKSKRVSANIMTQLLIDWLETRQNCVFDIPSMIALQDLWVKFYPNFGELGWTKNALSGMRSRTPDYITFESELINIIRTNFDRFRLEVLSSIVSMFRDIHTMGCNSNSEDCDNDAPVMDTLVALRLAIALMHGRRQQPMLVKNRALNMELVKVFMLKHADAEPVIINSITVMHSNVKEIEGQLGLQLVRSLEVVVRTLVLLQEIDWMAGNGYGKIHWSGDSVEKFTDIPT